MARLDAGAPLTDYTYNAAMSAITNVSLTALEAASSRDPRWSGKSSAAPAFPGTRSLLFIMLLCAPVAFGAVNTAAWALLSVLASLLLLLWAIESVRSGPVRITWSSLYIPAISLLLLGAIQMLTGRAMDPHGAREALLKLATDFIIFFIAVQLWSEALPAPSSRQCDGTRSADPVLFGVCGFSSRIHGETAEPRKRRDSDSIKASAPAWRMLGLVVTTYAFLLAIFAVLQFFSAHGLIYWHVKTDGWVFGPYVNHNHYAGLMEMLIPVSITYAVSKERGRSEHVLIGFAALFPIASVVLCGSRGGSAALLLEFLALTTAIVWLRPQSERRRFAILGLGGLAASAALILWLGGSSISIRLVSMSGLTSSPDVTLGKRLLVGRDTIRIICDHPWLGTGLGSFAAVYPQYQSFATNLVYNHAHNDYLEALAETGVLGGLLIVTAGLAFLCDVCKRLRAKLRTEAGWLQFGTALGCCGILVHSLADFNLHIPANASWFAFLLGVTQAARE